MNKSICKEFDIQLVKLEFERANAIDELGQAEIFSRYLQGGGITPNDIRHQLGKDEYSEDWGDKPIQIGLVEYQMGLLGAQGAAAMGETVSDEGEEDNDKQNQEDSEAETEEKTKIIDSVVKISGNGDERIKAINDLIEKMIKQNMNQVLVKF